MIRFALFFLLAMSPLARSADDPNCDPNVGLVDGSCLIEEEKEDVYDPCQGGGALEQGECARRALEKADAELNSVYRDLMAMLSDTTDVGKLTKRKLREDERKWVRWKDSHCEAYGNETGGVQMWKSTYTVACLAEVTEDQAQKLKRLLKEARPGSSPAKK